MRIGSINQIMSQLEHRRSTINVFRQNYQVPHDEENSLKRTWKQVTQNLSKDEQVAQTPAPQNHGSKRRHVTDSRTQQKRSIVSFRCNQSLIRLDFPVYHEDEVGASKLFQESLVAAGDDDDDHETTDSLKNHFVQVCKRELYDALLSEQSGQIETTEEYSDSEQSLVHHSQDVTQCQQQ